MRNGSWEEFKDRYRKEEKSSEWTLERIREANEKVARDEIRRLEIAEIRRKNTAPVDGMGGVTLSYVCPHCNWFPLEEGLHLVGIDGTRSRQ